VSQPDPAILDEMVLEQLLASVEGDHAFVEELVGAYLSDGEGHVDAARRAVAAEDAESLVRPAHTLKSSSATVGAMQLSATSRELEMAGRSGSIDAAAVALADRLQTEWAATTDAIRAWMAAGN
jgi:HPt (histidine-containing phosphotransfer) domain-containing protein